MSKNVSEKFKILSKKVKQQNIKLSINNGELTVQEVHFMPVNIFNAMPVNRLKARKQVIAKELVYSFEGQLFKTIMQQIEITVKNASEIKGKNVIFEYGIFIDNEFEYVNMGEYYIKDIEDDKKKEELVVTGYDKMLNFMKPFKQSDLQLTYPCKMSKLVNRIGEVCGVETYSIDFYNADLVVEEDFFTAQQLTYRDVLEKVAQTTLTTIFIKEDKLYLCRIGDSIQTLDSSYLSNLVIGEKFGPVNALVIGRGSVEDNIESVDLNSINTNGRCEIRFDENEFIDNKRAQVIDGMLEQINGIEYYTCEASNLGLMWLEPCDVITAKDRENSEYKTIYLSARVTINTGISGEMDIKIPETTTTEYKVTTKEEKKALRVERLAKKNEGLILDIIEETSENSEKLSQHEQTIDGMKDTIKNIRRAAITSVAVEYALSNSTTTEPQENWSTTAPEWQEGKYMWQRTITTYEDGVVIAGKAVCIAGATGQQGIPGTNGRDGVNGTNGKDGASNYVHIKYSAVANPTNAQMTETPNKYIGICVNATVEDPATANSYIWSKFEGQDGINGINGKNGIDGTSSYVHFAYSTSSNGASNFSKTNFVGATYIGVLTDDIEEDSSDYTKYSWSLIKGDKGIGIDKVETQYYLSTSKTAQTGGSWKTTQDNWKEGTYYWIRTKITYDNNEVEYTTPILNEDTNSLREAVTTVEKTANGLKAEVSKKIGVDELGTHIEQNWEHVKVAWNQISQYLKMEGISGKATLNIYDKNNNILMSLDEEGQHFYDGQDVFGETGVNTIDNKNYISFAITGNYGQSISNGMAWGITTKSDGKFWPVLYLDDFQMSQQNSDGSYGVLRLDNCDLSLGGMGTGLIVGGIKIYTDPEGNKVYFAKKSTGRSFFTIGEDMVYDQGAFKTYDEIYILDSISFYANQAGSNSFKIGNTDEYVLMTDNGEIVVQGSTAMFGSSNKKINFSVYPSYSASIHGDLSVDGSVYASNLSSDRRIKKNIKNTSKNALDIIKQIKHKQFEMKEDNKHYDIGYIAQEMEKIDSNFVLKREKTENTEERYYINEIPILATATKAIQEQQEIIETLKTQVKELKEQDVKKDKIMVDLMKRIDNL